MPRMKYSAEEKENALRLCEEVGVVKASEQTGISTFSLYKWRSRVEDEANMPPAESEEILAEESGVEAEDANLNPEGKTLGKRYSAEEKEKALQLYNEVGVTKASKMTGITISSLRRWHMNAKSRTATTAAAVDETPTDGLATDQNESQIDSDNASAAIVARLVKTPVSDLIDEENASEERIRLQLENATLKTQIVTLKCALRAFTE